MPLISYNRDIPAANNNPSQDQPNMLINTNNIDTLIAVDHFSFNDNAIGGTHRQVTLTNEAAPGLNGGDGVLYSDVGVSGNAAPFWQNAITSYEIALVDEALTSITNPGYISIGGIVMQWGRVGNAGASGTVVFPIPFPSGTNPFTIQLTAFTVTSTSANRPCSVITRNSTQFTYRINSGDPNDDLFWFAVGF